MVADFNGDGLDDILYRVATVGREDSSRKDVFLHLAQRGADGTISFGNELLVNQLGQDLSCVQLKQSRAADIDGDGRADPG